MKAIAQAHGGWVELKSRLGYGSTFTIVIPLVSSQDVAVPEQNSHHPRQSPHVSGNQVAGKQIRDYSR